MTGYAGEAGAVRLALEHRDELLGRFRPEYVRRMVTPVPMDADDMSEGLYAALWKLCEAWHCGVEVQLTDIPIRQETIEVCNFLDVDPYSIDSTGCKLWAFCPDETPEQVFSGEPVRIGRLIRGARRVIVYKDHIRYLTPPLQP